MEDELYIRSFEVGDQEQARWLVLEGLGEHFGYILHGEGISEMVRVSTRKDYRRRGIGQAIVTYLVDVARQCGDRRIIVKTNASWQDAINLYQRLDFVEYGRTASSVGLELLLAVQ